MKLHPKHATFMKIISCLLALRNVSHYVLRYVGFRLVMDPDKVTDEAVVMILIILIMSMVTL